MTPKNVYWSTKLAKMHILSFSFGEFKTVLQGPLLYFIETLLKLTLDGMHMFRPVTDQIVVNIQ